MLSSDLQDYILYFHRLVVSRKETLESMLGRKKTRGRVAHRRTTIGVETDQLVAHRTSKDSWRLLEVQILDRATFSSSPFCLYCRHLLCLSSSRQQ
jgi:hypothetical protein